MTMCIFSVISRLYYFPGLNPPWYLPFLLLFIYLYLIGWVMVMQGLMIYLGWRYPILGGRAVRTTLILFAILPAMSFIEYAIWGQQKEYSLINQLLLLSISLMTGVVAMVLARRIFKIVLVRQDEARDYQPTRLSIRELTVWTFVIASFLALHSQLIKWLQDSHPHVFWVSAMFSLSLSTFTVFNSVLMSAIPATLLIVAIVRLQGFSFYKWLPAVTVGYILWFLAMTIVHAFYNELGLPGLKRLAFGSLAINAVVTTLITAFVVWGFQKLGYQFLLAEKRVLLRQAAGNVQSDD